MARPRQSERVSFGEWIARLGSGAMGWKGWAVVAIITLLLIAFVGYEVGR
jgi:hypothetical protein